MAIYCCITGSISSPSCFSTTLPPTPTCHALPLVSPLEEVYFSVVVFSTTLPPTPTCHVLPLVSPLEEVYFSVVVFSTTLPPIPTCHALPLVLPLEEVYFSVVVPLPYTVASQGQYPPLAVSLPKALLQYVSLLG